ncbi:hypothetical protein BJ085DRAFT_37411 [Dimargaris cristalligena]|uniref:Extracellular membrane protein CFEM domain-containing protein n=1 Tax=Dimargaris cristalligena TaxID=215637 RepID=A0A4P9ZME4_9FUNG|nr:hypothetical protein BJ085DRAFT_37411 [Dimargaris cristalligena]|eukprot:RKP34534.1 hypothetical protein BJ085DRAFT_37411 [Dimargaris cristalligena]
MKLSVAAIVPFILVAAGPGRASYTQDQLNCTLENACINDPYFYLDKCFGLTSDQYTTLTDGINKCDTLTDSSKQQSCYDDSESQVEDLTGVTPDELNEMVNIGMGKAASENISTSLNSSVNNQATSPSVDSGNTTKSGSSAEPTATQTASGSSSSSHVVSRSSVSNQSATRSSSASQTGTDDSEDQSGGAAAQAMMPALLVSTAILSYYLR